MNPISTSLYRNLVSWLSHWPCIGQYLSLQSPKTIWYNVTNPSISHLVLHYFSACNWLGGWKATTWHTWVWISKWTVYKKEKLEEIKHSIHTGNSNSSNCIGLCGCPITCPAIAPEKTKKSTLKFTLEDWSKWVVLLWRPPPYIGIISRKVNENRDHSHSAYDFLMILTVLTDPSPYAHTFSTPPSLSLVQDMYFQ